MPSGKFSRRRRTAGTPPICRPPPPPVPPGPYPPPPPGGNSLDPDDQTTDPNSAVEWTPWGYDPHYEDGDDVIAFTIESTPPIQFEIAMYPTNNQPGTVTHETPLDPGDYHITAKFRWPDGCGCDDPADLHVVE